MNVFLLFMMLKSFIYRQNSLDLPVMVVLFPVIQFQDWKKIPDKDHFKIETNKRRMGHGVLIALGLLLVAQNDDHYDNLLNQLKETVTVGTYYSEYGRKPQFYLLRGRDGDDDTNKMYLFPSSSIVWTVQGDGNAVKYFHDDDGLQNPDTLIERIITAREDSQTKIDELFGRIGLPQQQVQVIRFTETYEQFQQQKLGCLIIVVDRILFI